MFNIYIFENSSTYNKYIPNIYIYIDFYLFFLQIPDLYNGIWNNIINYFISFKLQHFIFNIYLSQLN